MESSGPAGHFKVPARYQIQIWTVDKKPRGWELVPQDLEPVVPKIFWDEIKKIIRNSVG